MHRLRLVHWNAQEARARVHALRKLGYRAAFAPIASQSDLKGLGMPAPDLFLIDLTRLPMQGRDVAIHLRRGRTTRDVPIVFLQGAPEKVRRIRELFPDATFASWRGIAGAVRRALAQPSGSSTVPDSALAGYSGTPLPGKLGIREGMVVRLASAPPGLEKTVGRLPAGAILRRRAAGKPDMIIWFVSSLAVLRRDVARMGSLAGRGGLWIAWPKKASGKRTDLTQNDVRREGLASGLVDYKICAIDATWSGLRFARRRRR